MSQLHHLLKTKFYSGLPGTALACDLTIGQHPTKIGSFLDDHLPRLTTLQPTEFMPISHHHAGHHMVVSHGHLPHQVTPIAPLYVRDLAGRVLLTPLNIQQVNHAPLTPAACLALTPQQLAAAQLEQRFLTHLRPLELATQPAINLDIPAGYQRIPAYPNPHHYPYKLRVDTFYIDGFRLPQLELLHVKNTDQNQALNASRLFQQRWHHAQAQGQSYEDFYAANNGPAWYEELFQAGCTIIPTTEAFNGWYQVSQEYEMDDVYPGRVVAGLHTVVGMEDSNLPPQTIMRVISPGFATRQALSPAQVVISNGKYFQPESAPSPLLPNLSMPHARIGGGWGDVWIPTHPHHFAKPALWDWLPNGGFGQVQGPLWDPLHYIYGSTKKILNALRRHINTEQEPFPPAPSTMQLKFFPVTGMTWFDNPNTRVSETRQHLPTQHPLAGSILDSIIGIQEAAQIGYHPMPAVLEIELEPLLSLGRKPDDFRNCPSSLGENLVPIIKSHLNEQVSQQTMLVNNRPDARDLIINELHQEIGQNYPQLLRGQTDTSLALIVATVPMYLSVAEQAELFPNVKRLFSRVTFIQELAQWHPQLMKWLQTYVETSAGQNRLLYRLQRRYLAEYLEIWWSYKNMSEPNHIEMLPQQHADLAIKIASAQSAIQARQFS